MKFALLFLIITFATALPIHDVPTIAIADNNITIADNNITILTRTLLTTINDDDDFVDSVELVEATGDKLAGATGDKLAGATGNKLGTIGNKLVGSNNSTSHEHLTSNLQVYRNHTSHHIQKLETTIVAMLNKTRFLQKEEELSNKKNFSSSSSNFISIYFKFSSSLETSSNGVKGI